MKKIVSISVLGFLLAVCARPTFAATIAVQLVDGSSGNDSNNGLSWSTPKATVPAALSALPAEGGVIWVDSYSSSGTPMSLNLPGQPLDPGSKSLTLILGCSSTATHYSSYQIVLENNFHIQGCGSSASNGTVIVSENASESLIYLNQSAPVEGVVLRGLRLEPNTPANLQNGIDMTAPANGGLWYSTFDDIMIGNTTPFGGAGLNFVATATGSLNQFITIRDVRSFRPAGPNPACQWMGGNGQFVIQNLQCDGVTGLTSGTNINIESWSSSEYPYSLSFDELTTQNSLLAVNIQGAISITFHQAHLEHDGGGFLLSVGPGGINTYNIGIEDSEFATVGKNGGVGYLVKTTWGATNVNLNFVNNRIGATPDNYFPGFTTNLVQIGTLMGTGTYMTPQLPGLNVDGNFAVLPGFSKSATATLPSGRSVALYALESPENWFEDFGNARMTNGVASVQMDKEFLETVDTSAGYHVFVVANGPCGSLYVARKSATAFEVRETGNHACKAGFEYRVIAKRRGFEKLRLGPIQDSSNPK